MRGHRFLGTAALGLVSTAVAASAQTAPPPPAPDISLPAGSAPSATASADDQTTVADIVVTAQKRAENLQKVPIVITAATGAQLATAGVTSLPTLGAIAPGLNVRTSGGGVFQPSLRGIGTSASTVENPVALYIDGVYLPQQREGNRELPDVEQVAVLKGPQGTLFGRNATGGVIQITTRQPSDHFTFQGTAGLDSFLTGRVGLFVSDKIANGVAASLSADYAGQNNGYGRNFTTGNDTFKLVHSLGLRAKLRFTPSSRTEITLIADYLDRKDYTYSFIPYQGTSFVVPFPAVPGKQDTNSLVDPYSAFHGGGVSLTAQQDLGFAKLVSITSYRQGTANYLFDDIPGGRTPVFYVQSPTDAGSYKDFTEEFQLVSAGSGPVTYTAGVFYFYNRNGYDPTLRYFYPAFYGGTAAPTANFLTQSYGDETTQSVAPFGQVGVALTHKLRLTLGARYTHETRDLAGQVVANRYNGTTVATTYLPAELTINKPTWRLALDYQFTPDVLGYVSYNRGVKSGGFNILNPASPAYLPERLDAYEAGLKTELLDHRVRLNVGGFYYDYTNIQVTQFVGIAQTVVNGAKARLYGVDVDFNARVSREVTLSGGLEALSVKFTDYKGAVGSTPKPTGGATLFPVDATGRRIPLSQRFTSTLAIDYERPVSFGTLHLNATGNYNGDFYFEADNFLHQPAYTLVNVSAGWTSLDRHYSLTLWGRNLADERVLNNTTSQAPGYPASYANQPRTVGVTGKVSF